MYKNRLVLVIASGLLALTACGSDDDSGDTNSDDVVTADEAAIEDADDADDADDAATEGAAGGLQAEAAQRTIEEAAKGGVALDPACVNQVAAKLSDDDAAAIAAGNDGQISAAGNALSMELIQCADDDALADLFIQGMGQSGQAFDEDCVREKLNGIDIAEALTASEGGSPPADLVATMMECFEFGD